MVVVVDDPSSIRPVPMGAIVVAPNLGPLWTPLFPMLGGIILEQGSVGQHAAATAREYGVPALVGVPRATQLIDDGAAIELDADAGHRHRSDG